MRHPGYLYGSLAALMVPALAHAQQPASSPPQQAVAASPEDGLSEIIVTAQRRSENAQTVPIAITARTAEDLQILGVSDMMQLNIVSPGLNVRTAAGAFQPSIRGIGTSSTVVENPVALYIDGVYYPQQREGVRDLNDIEQMVVLKGPQGTLFGRNATAGVIQITTRKPSSEFGGTAHIEIDNYATVLANGYVTGKLSDGIAGSLSVSLGTQGNGWGTNYTTGADTMKLLHKFAARGKLLIEPAAGTEIQMIGDYSDWKRLSDTRQPYPGTALSFPGTGPLKTVYDSYAGTESFNALSGGGVSVAIDQDLGFSDFKSITAYRNIKGSYQFDNSSVPQPYFIVSSPDSPSESFSQEVQIGSKGQGPLKWVLGAYYFNYINSANPINRSFSGPFTPTATSAVRTVTAATEKTESIAPFGEVTLATSATKVTLGLRYTYERRSLQNASMTSVNGLGVSSKTVIDQAALTVNDVTYRAALSHEFSSNLMGYASFNTGFKSGGFNTVSPATPAYLPETLKAYEIGLKSELFERRLRLNAAAFYYDYSNLQVIQFIGLTQAVVNGPGAKLYGLDIDFDADLGGGFRATGGLALLHSEFTDYANAVFAAPRPGGGATIFAGDATGNRLPLAQDFTATLALSYEREVEFGTLSANVAANYNGDYFFSANNLFSQKAYIMLNASLTWRLPSDRVGFTLFGRNLAGAKVATQVTEQTLGFPALYGIAPRTVGLAVGFRF